MFMSRDTAQKTTLEGVLGKGIEIEGTVHSKGSIRVDGRIKGKVQCDADVMIGQSSVVNADIDGTNVIIAGSVTGNVKSTGRLEILSSGTLKGDVCSGSLVISEGARFFGSSQMADPPEQPRKAPSGRPKE